MPIRGRTYAIEPGETIELWAEYPAAIVNPRFRVEWGDGGSDNIGCGSCKLTHRYPRTGLFTVSATLDDRVGTMVTRMFVLNSGSAEQNPEHPWIDSHTGGGQTVYKMPARPLPGSPENLASWYQGVCEAAGLRPVSCDYHIYGSNYNATAWNAVILGNTYWSCNVSDGISSRTGWANVLTLHNPLLDDRGVCENGCSISGHNVFPICTNAP